MAELALRQLRAEDETAKPVESLLASDFPQRERMAELLRRGGPRALAGG